MRQDKCPEFVEAFNEKKLVFLRSVPGGIRTPDLILRRYTFYPAELRAQYFSADSMVFSTSIEIVIGPTPPGTGVI